MYSATCIISDLLWRENTHEYIKYPYTVYSLKILQLRGNLRINKTHSATSYVSEGTKVSVLIETLLYEENLGISIASRLYNNPANGSMISISSLSRDYRDSQKPARSWTIAKPPSFSPPVIIIIIIIVIIIVMPGNGRKLRPLRLLLSLTLSAAII